MSPAHRTTRRRAGRPTSVVTSLALLLGGLTGALATVAAPTPAAAAIPVPSCSAGVRIAPDPYAAHCRMGQAGASMSLATPHPTENGFMEGSFTMSLPAGSAVCGSCAVDGHYYGSAGISYRLYQPGASKATYDNIGLYFSASITSPPEYDLFGGGSFSGTYGYKDPGGPQGAIIVSAFINIAGNGNSESVASDDVIQFGSNVAPPTCKPPKPEVLGAKGSTVVLSVAPCAGSPINVDGYRVASYVGNYASTLSLTTYGKAQKIVVVGGLPNGAETSFTIEPYNGGGTGPKSDRSARALAPFVSTAAFVDRQVRDFAARAPSAAETSSWSSAITGGSKEPKALVAENLLNNAAWQTSAPVIRLFRAYFLRTPDQGGLAYWTGKVRSGTPLNTVSAAFAGSSEFKNRYGPLTNLEFVELVYQNVLGRPGDSGGVSYWTKQLDLKKKNRGQVMTGFSESNEYKTKTKGAVDVVRTFTAMLGRSPSLSEVSFWAPKPSADLVQSILGSGAYSDRMSALAAPIVTTQSLMSGKVGTAYSVPLAVHGGAPALTWSLIAGTLPTGVTLNPSTGVLSGTPTTAGLKSFTVKVTDSKARTSTAALSINVAPAG
jgi:hypothetical protein